MRDPCIDEHGNQLRLASPRLISDECPDMSCRHVLAAHTFAGICSICKAVDQIVGKTYTFRVTIGSDSDVD